jgi:Flp pilus assembly protein TadD
VFAIRAASRPATTRTHRVPQRILGRAALLTAFVFLAASILAASSKQDLFRFDGQVTLPPHTLSPKKRLVILLHGVDAPFSGRTWADWKGRFHFSDVMPGTYSLGIYVPDQGGITQTVDITKSFADRKGRIERKFEFNEQTLRALLNSEPQSIVSVRELSIPPKSVSEYRKAQSRLAHHDVDGAIEHLKKAVALAPQFIEAVNDLGTISFQQREFAQAEHYFRQALQQDPHAYEPLVNLGGALLAQGRAREALAVNLHAQDTRPSDPLANAQLGLSYFAIGEYEPAIACFRTTEQLDPAHFSNPQITLAEIYIRREDSAAAVRELESFLKFHPDSPHAQSVRETIDELKVRSRHGEPLAKTK